MFGREKFLIEDQKQMPASLNPYRGTAGRHHEHIAALAQNLIVKINADHRVCARLLRAPLQLRKRLFTGGD
jgi:hypothetical protein